MKIRNKITGQTFEVMEGTRYPDVYELVTLKKASKKVDEPKEAETQSKEAEKASQESEEQPKETEKETEKATKETEKSKPTKPEEGVDKNGEGKRD